MIDNLGLLGLLFLLAGWFPQTIEVIKSKRSALKTEFSLFYAIGSLMLCIYAFNIGDRIFVALNTCAFLMAAVTLYYKVRYK